jgi:hypothetical protein
MASALIVKEICFFSSNTSDFVVIVPILIIQELQVPPHL